MDTTIFTNGEIAILKQLVGGYPCPFHQLHPQGRNMMLLAVLAQRGLIVVLNDNDPTPRRNVVIPPPRYQITDVGKAAIAPYLANDADLFLGSLAQRDQEIVAATEEIKQRTDDCAALAAKIEELETTLKAKQKTIVQMNDLIRAIRDEVMQYPMNESAGTLADRLYQLLR